MKQLIFLRTARLTGLLIMALLSTVAKASNAYQYLVHTGPNGYPPFIFTHERASQVHYSGVIIDLLNAFEKSNPQFTHEYNSMSRTRANLHIERGDFSDLMFFSEDFASPETKENYVFTDELYTLKDIVVTTADSKIDYQKPSDLYGKSVATLRGYSYLEFDELFEKGEINSVAVDLHTQAIGMLKKKRVDAYFGNMVVTPFYLKQLGMQNSMFNFSETTLSEITFAFMIHRDKPELFSALNNFIKQSQENGELQSILDNYIR